ncbi:MAG TPA: class I SAM-dependent methyltransferase [Spongiibacteraceae bacterium]|nr:SAM-dependent methyltransferase [Spongiibacteraceae bacterium]HCS27794.1 class I SAM-dependent methyltransferase [Spongiibacteraceae bacterium]|tara:strand:+ start:2286 stop:3032 length:747 start_codon:yes stop_codon:yes gene_type:complete
MDTQQVYDSNAEKWLRLAPSSLSDFTARPLVFEACGNVAGRSVLDIGCGEGYCARELKRRGAGDYLGVDLSEQMIQAAQLQEAQDQFGIDFRACNIVDFEPTQQFDLCIAVFLFNYLRVEEMNRVFAMVNRALKPGGEFIFSVPHPFFPFVRSAQAAPFYFSAKGKNYFADVDAQFEGEIWKRGGEPLHVQCVHKTLTDYFSGLRGAGFSTLPEIQELTVTPELAATDEAFFAPLLNEPLHMLFKIAK